MQALLLTQAQCAFCEQAKGILDRLAPTFGFSVETLDLATPEGVELARANSLQFPPGLFVDGELVFYGRLSERRLRKELEHRMAARADTQGPYMRAPHGPDRNG